MAIFFYFLKGSIKNSNLRKIALLILAAFGIGIPVHDVWHYTIFQIACLEQHGFSKLEPVNAPFVAFEGKSFSLATVYKSRGIIAVRHQASPENGWNFDEVRRRRWGGIYEGVNCRWKIIQDGQLQNFDPDSLMQLAGENLCISEKVLLEDPQYKIRYIEPVSMFTGQYWGQGRTTDFFIQLVDMQSSEVLSEFRSISDRAGLISRIVLPNWSPRHTCEAKRASMAEMSWNYNRYLENFLVKAVLPLER